MQNNGITLRRLDKAQRRRFKHLAEEKDVLAFGKGEQYDAGRLKIPTLYFVSGEAIFFGHGIRAEVGRNQRQDTVLVADGLNYTWHFVGRATKIHRVSTPEFVRAILVEGDMPPWKVPPPKPK